MIRKSLVLVLICLVSVTALLAHKSKPRITSNSSAVNPKAAEQPAAVVVTTRSGEVYKVRNLRARYSAMGTWMGGPPTRTARQLCLAIYGESPGRVEWSDTVVVEFSSIRKVSFGERRMAPNLEPEVVVEKRDGSRIVITEKKYEEYDPTGKSLKSIPISRLFYKAGSASDGRGGEVGLYLDDFEGTTATPLG